MTITIFNMMNMSRGFVILSAFSIPFSFAENDVMHPVRVDEPTVCGMAAAQFRASDRELLISVVGSCSVRDLPGRWQFRRVLPGLAVVGRTGK